MEDVGRTSVPTTSFVSSPAFEKERMLYLATSLAEGFYNRHEFLITSEINHKFRKNCVVVPVVLSKASKNFWEEARLGGQTMPKKLSETMWKEFEDVKLPVVKSEIVQIIESEWRKVEWDFWKFIENNFVVERKWLGSVEVRVSKMGSLGSHYLLSKQKGQKLTINVREDCDSSTIASLIILALVWPLKEELNLSFNKRMVLRDFMMSRPEMKKIFPNWKRTSYDNVQLPEELRKKSTEYLDYLGVPRQVDPVEMVNKNWPVFGDKEAKFLKLMIKNRGELVSYDQIADEVWGSGEFKTYWAINKIYQRTQKKIDKLGIFIKIKGFRGRGYRLT